MLCHGSITRSAIAHDRGEAPVGALDLIHGRGSIQTQEFVEIHYLASPLSWAIADRVIEPWQSIARSGDGRRLS